MSPIFSAVSNARGLSAYTDQPSAAPLPLRARGTVPMMKAQTTGQPIIDDGSISAHTPRPGSIGYTATKHTMTGLTKSLSLDVAFDIACGQIDIGNAASEMTQQIEHRHAAGQWLDRPKQVFDARHVAEAVRYMASLPLDTTFPVPDHHGDQDTIYRARLAGGLVPATEDDHDRWPGGDCAACGAGACWRGECYGSGNVRRLEDAMTSISSLLERTAAEHPDRAALRIGATWC